jgi:F-type H+-transporting ATPase subunit a
MYHFVGIKRQGLGGYLKSSLIPPGVPKLILPLLMLIELITILITRPLSLCVRLFANMFAGHLLLITFSIICSTLFALQWQIIILPFSGALLVALTGFEVLVAFLQAFIFTILTGVYIGQSMHPEH